jgi:bifunctional UDP-N-acetylglucosamine pyrophosphorylase / glucosamine-1-phosphate N-acetyltransferase
MSKRSQKRYNSVRCLMLAAGLGTRMNTSLPKPLHRIADKTMIERLIDTVKSIGIKDIVVVAGHGLGLLEDVLKKYNIKAIKQKRLLGSADAVKAAEAYFKKFSGDILVLYTDTPLITGQTIKGLIDTHINSDAACTLLTAMANNPFGYGRIIRDASGDIINIVEEKDATDQQKNIRQVNVGAYCFKKNGLFENKKF